MWNDGFGYVAVPADLTQPIFQITIPIVVTIGIAAFSAIWSTNSQVEEVSKRVDDLGYRVDE